MNQTNYYCEKCKKYYSSNQTLWAHNKKFHINEKFKCDYCDKIYSFNQSRWYHMKKCKLLHNEKMLKEAMLKDKIYKLEEEVDILNNKINEKSSDINMEKFASIILNKNALIEKLKNKMTSILDTNIDMDKINDYTKEDLFQKMKYQEQKIKCMEKLYLKKQERQYYPETNIVYIITTNEYKNNRIYIIGKTTNLTNRLSTYNKTAEHIVVYYKECNSVDDMDTVEIMVLKKLNKYREEINRDRFILPEDKDISFFTNIIEKSVEFINTIIII